MASNQELAYALRQSMARIAALETKQSKQADTFEDELAKIPGRRVFYNMVAGQDFTATQNGSAGSAMTYDVSQDGPFIMTHYPLAVWRPTLPTTATNFGKWRPVQHFPLPDQVIDDDIISLSWAFSDSGSGRNFQTDSQEVPAGMFSTPGVLMELPKASYFRPNSTITITPTYEDIEFAAGGTATTGGRLVIVLPGYKIVNLG